MNDVIVADSWQLVYEHARERRLMRTSVALRTTEAACTYWIVVDALDDNATLGALSSHLRSIGGTVVLTCVRVLGQLAAHIVVPGEPAPRTDRDLYPVEFLESGSRADGTGRAVSVESGWLGALVQYTCSTEKRQLPCLVLWGRPGCGKSFALQKLRDDSHGESVVGREVIHFSCSDVEWDDGEEKKRQARNLASFVEMLDNVAEKAERRPVVLCIDDFDSLVAKEKEVLVELLVELKCPRILVTDDWWSMENGSLLRKRSKDFVQLRANGVHPSSIARHLLSAFPEIGRDGAKALSEGVRGDCRAAILAAQIGVGAAGVQDYCDTQAPHYSLFECVGAAKHRLECERRFGEHSDVQSLGELVAANAPRIVLDDKRVAEQVLDALAECADLSSLATLYGEAQRESGFAGGDGEAVDKALHFELAVTGPVFLTASVAELAGGKVRPLKLEFPARQVFFKARALSSSYARVVNHIETFGQARTPMTFAEAAEQRSRCDDAKLYSSKRGWHQHQSDTALRCDTYAAVLFGDLHDSADELLELVRARGSTDAHLVAIAKRCAAAGLEAIDFVFLCQHELRCLAAAAAKEVPADSTIEAHFKRSGTLAARAVHSDVLWKRKALTKAELTSAAQPRRAQQELLAAEPVDKSKPKSPQKKRARVLPAGQQTIEMSFFRRKGSH